jgi:hypothetical protein
MNDGYELRLLERVAAEIAYPATPQLRGRVLAAIPHPPTSSPSGWKGGENDVRLAPMFAAVVAAVAVVGGAIALGVPSSRSAIAEFFGIEGSDVEILPTAAPGTEATPLPSPVDLPVTARTAAIEDLDDAVGFDVAFADDQQPGRAYVVSYLDEPVAIMQYYGFDLWEAQLESGMVVRKGVPPGVRVEELELRDGVPARWITGGAHLLVFRTEDGTEIEESMRAVRRNTLIWRTEHAFYRIETELPLEDAREIANTLP